MSKPITYLLFVVGRLGACLHWLLGSLPHASQEPAWVAPLPSSLPITRWQLSAAVAQGWGETLDLSPHNPPPGQCGPAGVAVGKETPEPSVCSSLPTAKPLKAASWFGLLQGERPWSPLPASPTTPGCSAAKPYRGSCWETDPRTVPVISSPGCCRGWGGDPGVLSLWPFHMGYTALQPGGAAVGEQTTNPSPYSCPAKQHCTITWPGLLQGERLEHSLEQCHLGWHRSCSELTFDGIRIDV